MILDQVKSQLLIFLSLFFSITTVCHAEISRGRNTACHSSKPQVDLRLTVRKGD